MTLSDNGLDPRDWVGLKARAYTFLETCICHLSHSTENHWNRVPSGYVFEGGGIDTNTLAKRPLTEMASVIMTRVFASLRGSIVESTNEM